MNNPPNHGGHKLEHYWPNVFKRKVTLALAKIMNNVNTIFAHIKFIKQDHGSMGDGDFSFVKYLSIYL